jgi:dipeptidyl aminopeptidase/acylaminoacyl peptidase
VSSSNAAEQEVIVRSAGVELAGSLTLPDPAVGLVLFAHGSGSSRFSSRNRFVASVLMAAQLARDWFLRHLSGARP